MESLTAPIINFLILVVFLGVKLRKPLQNFVEQRHHTIRNDVNTVREQLRFAQEKYEEFSSKLKAVQSEVSSMRDQTRQEVADIKQRLMNEARRSSSLIISDSKNSADGLFAQLKNHLYSDLSGKILDRAEELLRERLTGDDRARIRQEFSQQVESIR
jgi:F0F1-type ATP synthase membrane subunit b/b'